MAVVDAYSMLTAIEQVKRSGNDDQRRIIEELTKTNQIMADAPMDEANDRTLNTGLVRTYVPHGTHRAYNEGVDNVATQTKTVHDYMCNVAAFSNVDKDEADQAANRDQFMMDEAAGIIQGMGMDQADDLMYGNHDLDPKYCTGLITRRPVIDNNLCIDMGGTNSGHLSSLVLVKWNRQHTKLIYPKGAKGCGVNRLDRGLQTVEDANGKKFLAYQNYFDAKYGIASKTEKSIIRLANIDITSTTGDDILKALIKAVPHLILGDGKLVAYANADVYSLIDLSIVDKGNVQFTPENAYGAAAPMRFRNITFRQVDALLNTEAKVNA